MRFNKELILSVAGFLAAFVVTQIPALNPYERELVSGFSLVGFVMIGVDVLDIRGMLNNLIYGAVDKTIEGLDISVEDEIEDLIEKHFTVKDNQVEISREQLKVLMNELATEVAYDALELFGFKIRERK